MDRCSVGQYDFVQFGCIILNIPVVEPDHQCALVGVDAGYDAYIPVENEVLLGELFEEFASLLDEIDEEEE